jgi:hypothetical protein
MTDYTLDDTGAVIDARLDLANSATQPDDVRSWEAALAQQLGGLYFKVSESRCFQEASLTATTPSKIGDQVGLIKGQDGKWFALAKNANTCGVLRVDNAGNLYIDGAGTTASNAAFYVRDKDNNPLDPTLTWTMILSAAGTGRPAATLAQTNVNGKPLEIQQAGFRFTGPTGDWKTTTMRQGFRGEFPWVARLKKDGTAFQAWNGTEAVPADSYTTLDESGMVRALSIFSDARSGLIGQFPSGKLYGLFFVPSEIDEKTSIAIAESLRKAGDPSKKKPVDDRPIFINFMTDQVVARDEQYNVSEAITAGILSDNGGGLSYNLNYMNWWDQDRTYVFDLERKATAPATEDILLQTVSSNEVQETIFNRPVFGLLYSQYGSSTTTFGNTAGIVGPANAEIPRSRVAIQISPKKRIVTIGHGGTAIVNSHVTFPMIPPTALIINKETTEYTILRMAIYPGKMDMAEIHEAFDRAGTVDIHYNGDSFVSQNMASATNEVFMQEGYDNLRWTEDGVGGLGFYESKGRGHAQRYLNRPFDHSKVLLICDGGFGGEPVTLRTAIMNMAQANYTRGFDQTGLEGAAGGIKETLPRGVSSTRGESRAFFVEPNPLTQAFGSTNRDEFESLLEICRGMFNQVQAGAQIIQKYIPTIEAMLSAYDEFGPTPEQITTNKTRVAQGLWGVHLSADNTHPNVNGKIPYARATMGVLIDNAVLSGATSLPAAPTGLAVDGSGVLTWDRVEWANAGKHPVRGYRVYKDGVALPSQQSLSFVSEFIQANGGEIYGKQYIREYDTTSHGSGDYTVAAITSKGTGPQSSSVTV